MDIKQQRQRIHHLLHATGLMVHKQAILEGYGVASTTELSEDDLKTLIAYLQQQLKGKDTPEDIRRWRSNVLTLLNKLGIYVTNDDWDRVNQYLLQPKIAGKLLPAMNVAEMKHLCAKLRAILAKKP